MLSHHALIMLRRCRTIVYCCSKSGTPCKFCHSPDIFQMAHTIIVTFFCTYNNTVNLCITLGNGVLQSVQIQLIIAVRRLCGKFRCHSGYCLDCSLCFSERQTSVSIQSYFFVIFRCFAQCVIRITCTFKQSLFSFVCSCAGLTSVRNSNIYRRLICDFFILAQINTLANFYREGYTSNFIAAAAHMIRSACKTACTDFIFRCRGECIYFYTVIYICCVKLVIWNIHQDICSGCNIRCLRF